MMPKMLLLFMLVASCLSHEIVRQKRQDFQFPDFSREMFGRSDTSDIFSNNNANFPNLFNQKFTSFSSTPFGSFSFQPSFSIPAAPAASSSSSFPSFDKLASAFGSNMAKPTITSFFDSSQNVHPQQRPEVPTMDFASFGSPPAPSPQSMNLQLPAFTSNFPTQSWDITSDMNSQIGNIFKQNGQWALPANFVQQKFDEAWAKSTAQFGTMPSVSGGAATGFPTLKFGSAGSQNDIFAGTKPDSLDIAKNAFTLEDFSKSLSKQLNLNKTSAAFTLPLVSINPNTVAPAAQQVPATEVVPDDTPIATPASQPECSEQPAIPVSEFLNPARQPACARNKYRTHSGECNNLCFPTRGKDSTVFIRLLGPDYADGIAEPRKNSQGRPLPSARFVSSALIGNKVRLAPTWTNMFMAFGQFTDHDLTQTPRATLSDDAPQCCGTKNPHPQCLSITIPDNDPFFSKFGQTCMEFVRSLPGVRPGCRLGGREQINQLSAFIDGGQVYGTKQNDVKNLRTFTDGRLKSIAPIPSNPSYTLMTGDGSNTLCVDGSKKRSCFKAGDNRCNIQIGLQTLHTIFMRHHNNVVGRLQRLNPHWDDETLYQEGRRIVGAQLQHITYNEWLPMLLGPDAVNKMGLGLLTSGRFTGYNVTIHPGLINEFAAAAFRAGHSMVPGKLDRLDANFELKSTVRMRDTFFKSSMLYEDGAVDEFVRGLTKQLGKGIDNNVVSDLSQQLFNSQPNTFGLDLVSLNIQRGRDHGLPGYMKYRRLCGLPTVDNFGELRNLNSLPDETINRLASVYESVEDIDLYPAGISEFPVGGAIIGPTFACIISEQFWRLRVADRFWYENDLPFPSRFSDAQLAQIRKTTLARILCDSVPGIQSVQLNVFESISNSNPRVPCNQIPTVSFKSWTGAA